MAAHTRRGAGTQPSADAGFTLVELLVVMLIIGILAAITIPVLTRQRVAAVDTSMKSDLHNAAMAIEHYRVEHDAYPATWAAVSGLAQTDPDTTFQLDLDAGGAAFCLTATRTAGSPPGSGPWSYDSDGGGLVDDNLPCS